MKKLALSILLFSASLFAQEQEAILKDLSGGMASYPTADKIPDNAAAYLQNFYTDIEPLLVERNGYVRRDSTILGGGTGKPVYGSWEYVDASGNDWYISYSSRTFYKNTIGQVPAAFGPIMTVDAIPDCAKNLGKFMCVNGADTPWEFDGSTTTITVAAAPLGTLIEPWRTRFVISNSTGSKSILSFSADGDEKTWTIGGNPTDPFAIQIEGSNDGDYTRCLIGSYQDSLIIGKKYSMWAVDGFDQSDVILRNISKNIGCIEPRVPQEVDGELVFLSVRGLEAMNGRTIRLISEPIRDITDVMVRNTLNQRSNIQTTQADFNAGTIHSPAGGLSTAVIPGAITLSTRAVPTFMDTNVNNFNLGTLTGVSATISSGSLVLGFSSATVYNSFYPGSDNSTCGSPCSGSYYQSRTFTPTDSFIFQSLVIRLKRTGSPGDFDIFLMSDSGGAPGTVLDTANVTDGSVSLSPNPITVTFTGNVPLVSGTAYWIQVHIRSVCDGSNKIEWYGTGITNTVGLACGNSLSGATLYAYQVNGATYNSSGNFLSRTFDTTFTTNTWLWSWGFFDVTQTTGPATTIRYEVQTSSNNINFDPLAPVVDLGVPTSTVREYIRYKASFTTDNGTTTPRVDDVALNYGPFISTAGMFTSQLISIGNVITAWGPVTISDVKSTGTITYQFGSTTTASVAAITNWTTVVNGGAPTVSTGPYAAFRSSYTPTNGSADLEMSEFTTTWIEGGVIPSPVGGVYNRRFWLSYTTSTVSAPYHDSIIIWQRNKTFTLFKGMYAGSFTPWRDDFYFGNSNSTGLVYKTDIGDNDDGAAISSIYKSKSYDLGAPYRDKDLRNMYMNFTGNTTYSGSFTVVYDLDRLGQMFSLGSASLNEGIGQINAKFPFPFSNPTMGRELQFTLTKTGTGNRLKLHDIVVKYDVQEEQ